MKNKVVLITGASGDIGMGLVKAFAHANYNVIANYNKTEAPIKELSENLNSQGFNVICFKADVSNTNDVYNMVQEAKQTFGHIDVLINNAGVSSNKLLIDENDESIYNTISVNLLGTINCTKEVCNLMIKQGFGNIINISSIWGTYGASCESIYSASKGGINAFTKAMAKELAYSNINVNAITPGVVDTKMIKNFTKDELEGLKNEIPFKRFATPEDIANLALFLASDKANYITGQIIQIDGGFCL